MTNYVIFRTEEFSDNSKQRNLEIRKGWPIMLHLEQRNLDDNSQNDA